MSWWTIDLCYTSNINGNQYIIVCDYKIHFSYGEIMKCFVHSCVFIIANTHTLTLYVYIILCSVENKYSDTQIKIRLHDIG